MVVKKIYIHLQSQNETTGCIPGNIKRAINMIIKKLELSNFQVIKEFNADFEGNIYFITGDNELGKSTLLKAIGILLTGNRDEVLRAGEDKGFAKMVVGNDGEEFEVELKFTKKNPRGTLSIKQKTTGMKSDNVSMIQKIFGYTDFDAVEFSRWSETAEGRRKQIEIVRSLLPKEVNDRITSIDNEVLTTKEKRKEVNSTLKAYTAMCEQAEKQLNPGDVKKYANKIDITTLLEEQKINAQLIEKAKTVREAKAKRSEQLAQVPERINNLNNDYKAKRDELELALKKLQEWYETELTTIKEDEEGYKARIKNAELWLEKYEENNPEKKDVSDTLREAEEHNRKNALVVDFMQKKKQREESEKVSMEYDDKINKLLKEREGLISESKLPINGLSFTDEGLELNGIPFVAGKVSDSQIMEVATKLVIATNPNVKVFRIARGESLGQKRLQAILDLAKKEGFQGFIESVVRGQQDLIIEEYEEADK